MGTNIQYINSNGYIIFILISVIFCLFYPKCCLGNDKNLSIESIENNNFQCNTIDDANAFSQSLDLLSKNNLIDSKQCLQNILTEFPLTKHKVDIFYTLGQISLINNELEDAMNNFISSYDENTTNFRAAMNLFEISKILFNLKQNKKACLVLDKITSKKNDLIIEKSLLNNINDLCIKKCSIY